MATATEALTERDYMELREGVGVIPEKFRNKGFEKLEWGPGEGGLGDVSGDGKAAASGDTMDAFLAGVAAGADPKDLAKELRSPSASKRGRR